MRSTVTTLLACLLTMSVTVQLFLCIHPHCHYRDCMMVACANDTEVEAEGNHHDTAAENGCPCLHHALERTDFPKHEKPEFCSPDPILAEFLYQHKPKSISPSPNYPPPKAC